MSAQYAQGYERANYVIASKPSTVEISTWVWHPDNKPLPSDSAAFREGYAQRAKEAGAICPLVVK